MIGHHVYSDVLALSAFITGSGRGLRSTRQMLCTFAFILSVHGPFTVIETSP